MLEITDLEFGYRGRHNMLYNGLTLNLAQGHINGILGKNGSGKSTLLYLIAGLLRPFGGHIRFNGKDTTLRRPTTTAGIFILPEEFYLPACNFKSYVQRYGKFYPRFSEEILRASLDEFDLAYDMPLNELSMGNKKKAYVCFALATNVPLLLMDEPTNGLDIPSKSQFRQAVARTMTDDKSILISTHQVRDIDALLDHITIIDSGKVLLNSNTYDITSALTFREIDVDQPADNILFSQPSLKGNKVIARNLDGEDTQLDLELLFTAVVCGKAGAINSAITGTRDGSLTQMNNNTTYISEKK